MAWHGMAWHGMARHGMAWHGISSYCTDGMVWHGIAWHGTLRVSATMSPGNIWSLCTIFQLLSSRCALHLCLSIHASNYLLMDLCSRPSTHLSIYTYACCMLYACVSLQHITTHVNTVNFITSSQHFPTQYLSCFLSPHIIVSHDMKHTCCHKDTLYQKATHRDTSSD